jgi:hypothetical protein
MAENKLPPNELWRMGAKELSIAAKTFGQGDKFAGYAVRHPDHAPVWQSPEDNASRRASQSPDPVAGLEVRQFREGDQPFFHDLTVQHTGHVMGRQRGSFPAPTKRELDENGIHDAAGNLTERVAVKEKERSRAMAVQKEVEGFTQR